LKVFGTSTHVNGERTLDGMRDVIAGVKGSVMFALLKMGGSQRWGVRILSGAEASNGATVYRASSA